MQKLPGEIASEFLAQADACERLGSPFTAALCRIAAEHGLPDGPIYARLSQWGDSALARDDALALRFAGALHHLVLTGTAPELTPFYPPDEVTDDDLAIAIAAAVDTHSAHVDRFLDGPPQTNETARSAVLLPGYLLLAARFDMPMVMSELGSSAGLNQNWNRYFYDYGNWQWGEPDSPVALACEWRSGNPPATRDIAVLDHAGCDIAPVLISERQNRERLMAYVWADQPARLARLAGALAIATDYPPQVEAETAARWIEQRLSQSEPDTLHVVFHSIMWQYMPATEQRRIADLLAEAGNRIAPNAPLAWLRMEPDETKGSAALSLTTWSGASDDGRTIELARVDFHGRWIEWNDTR